VGERCVSGVCGTPESTVSCAAKDDCHLTGACDRATGTCSAPLAADGAACDDHSLCTTGETCHAGACVAAMTVSCAPGDQCHEAGACDPATGTCSNPPKPDGASCDDGDACTQLELCVAGVCGHPISRKSCPAPQPCHAAGVCSSPGGACIEAPLPDGTACAGGACIAGSCVLGADAGLGPVTTSGCGCTSSGELMLGLAALLALRRKRR
jgi:MYXO-CTERM domain-containing protein